jgi:hypothetical protein
MNIKNLQKELNKTGLLLLSGGEMPSLTTLIAGKPFKGSWWGHAKGNLMYNLSSQLAEQPDVMVLKLVNKKVTFVQKKLWDLVYVLATQKAPWQLKGLSPEAEALLSLVEKKGELRTDDPATKKTFPQIAKLTSLLETRLLVYSESQHTDAGHHVRVLQTWKKAFQQKGHRPKKILAAQAAAELEKLTSYLPWKKKT